MVNDRTSGVLGKISLISFMIGVLGLLLGSEYGLAWPVSLGLVSIGLALIAGAFEIVLARRGHPLSGVGRWQSGWGIALYPMSFVILITGFCLFALGLLRIVGLETAFGAYLNRRPGLAIAVVGTCLAAIGTTIMIGKTTWRDSRWDPLVYLPARAVGAALTLAGLAALALGIFELALPAVFDRWALETLDTLNPFR